MYGPSARGAYHHTAGRKLDTYDQAITSTIGSLDIQVLRGLLLKAKTFALDDHAVSHHILLIISGKKRHLFQVDFISQHVSELVYKQLLTTTHDKRESDFLTLLIKDNSTATAAGHIFDALIHDLLPKCGQ